jgi:Serine acetyltransferase, N-terminal
MASGDPSLGRSGYAAPPYPRAFYPDIDLSIPDSVYSDDVDLVWDLLRWEAYQNQQQQHEPLLVSFLHSTILNHNSLESSLAFLLANRLQSPAMMISTQLQALILSALQECPSFRRKLRADIMAVRDRDPACHTLPDVFLYFKGFHALQSHRTAHVLWQTGRRVLAQYLQSQVSQIFQIDIHPNATIGSGIMLDHGTGIVIGETVCVYFLFSCIIIKRRHSQKLCILQGHGGSQLQHFASRHTRRLGEKGRRAPPGCGQWRFAGSRRHRPRSHYHWRWQPSGGWYFGDFGSTGALCCGGSSGTDYRKLCRCD